MVDHLKVFKWLCLGLVDRLRAATAAAAKSRSTFVFILFWSVVGIQECGKCCWIRMPSHLMPFFLSPQACTNHLLYDCQTGKPQRYFSAALVLFLGQRKWKKSQVTYPLLHVSCFWRDEVYLCLPQYILLSFSQHLPYSIIHAVIWVYIFWASKSLPPPSFPHMSSNDDICSSLKERQDALIGKDLLVLLAFHSSF